MHGEIYYFLNGNTKYCKDVSPTQINLLALVFYVFVPFGVKLGKYCQIIWNKPME